MKEVQSNLTGARSHLCQQMLKKGPDNRIDAESQEGRTLCKEAVERKPLPIDLIGSGWG